LEGVELWELPHVLEWIVGETMIAPAYTGRHQIVNAIAECEGGDDFVRQWRGIHCGIRKHCVSYLGESDETTTEPCGVTMLDRLDTDAATEEMLQKGSSAANLVWVTA
jgi:hypothetical protein